MSCTAPQLAVFFVFPYRVSARPAPSSTAMMQPPTNAPKRRAPPPFAPGGGGSGAGASGIPAPLGPLAERAQPRRFQVAPIEEVERVERDQPAVRLHDVDAGLLDGAHVEGVRVGELEVEHAE